MGNSETKNNRQFYVHEELCDFFYRQALAHCVKAFAKHSKGWSLTCETNGLTKRLILKSKDRCGYLSLFINRTSIKATAVARNRLHWGVIWEYLHENRTDIILAEFDKYVPKFTSMSNDFADVIKRLNALIDYTVAVFDYTGYAGPIDFSNEEQSYEDFLLLQHNMKELAQQDILHYGVHTKKEYESMVNSIDSHDI